jgi:RNA polymerase sigma-70 factor, ECF subfamily
MHWDETMNSEYVAQSSQDFDLIDQAQSGSLEAFNALVLKYQSLLYNHAYTLLAIRQSAEDVTQDSILKAFRKIEQFKGGSFRSWLLRIVTNTCCDEIRRLKRQPVIDLIDENDHIGEQESPVWLVDPCPSVTAMIEQKELSRTIYQYLAELPGIFRTAITLVNLYDFDYIEAASILNIPLGTLKSRLARGRLQMRDRLQLSLEPSPIFFLDKFKIKLQTNRA